MGTHTEPADGRYTIEELEQAFQHYWHAKTRFLKVAERFCKQPEAHNEVQILEKALPK